MRARGGASRSGCWRSKARLVVLQVISTTDLVARAERQQMSTVDGSGQARRDLRSQRPAARLQRRRRHHLRGPDRDRRSAETVPPRSARVSTTAPQRRATSCVDRLAHGSRAFVYVKRRVTPPQAKRVAALELKGIGFSQGEQALLPESRACRARARLRRHRQRRPGRPRSDLRQDGARARRQAAGADRRASARLQPPRALAHRRRFRSS